MYYANKTATFAGDRMKMDPIHVSPFQNKRIFILFSGNEMKKGSFASTGDVSLVKRSQHFEPRGIRSIADYRGCSTLHPFQVSRAEVFRREIKGHCLN